MDPSNRRRQGAATDVAAPPFSPKPFLINRQWAKCFYRITKASTRFRVPEITLAGHWLRTNRRRLDRNIDQEQFS